MIIQLKIDDMRGKIPQLAPAHGCFIAGGAVRQWFYGSEEASDIDIFGPTPQATEAFVKDTEGLEQVDDHKNATSYKFNGQLVQVMKLYRQNVEVLVADFDYNVCQFAWSESGIFATQEAVIGVLRGHLAVSKITKEFAVDSLRRAFKYQCKGFKPCNGTIRDIALALRDLTPEEIQNQVAISPHGGNWIVRFD